MRDFSDYIVFVDESGDHGLKSIDPEFPVFALVFCVVKKEDYLGTIVPAMQDFKFRYWGHDSVILHENEIRKEKGDFAFLTTNRELRENFLSELSEIIQTAPINIITSVIDKTKLISTYKNPWNPYEIALHFCLERLLEYQIEFGQGKRLTHVIFECRGRDQDKDLEYEFRKICDENQQWGYRRNDFSQLRFEPRFAKKSINSSGLQLADLTARPIALKTMRPNQSNRAYDIIASKISSKKVFP